MLYPRFDETIKVYCVECYQNADIRVLKNYVTIITEYCWDVARAVQRNYGRIYADIETILK